MKRSVVVVLSLALVLPAVAAAQAPATIPIDVRGDKIKGGWAGQTIGVTFGGPTEFRYIGTMVPDYTPIAVRGLLYGNGDMTQALAISTRAGQDSDCNPSSAAGIFGTMLGYAKIPAYWMPGLAASEATPFPMRPGHAVRRCSWSASSSTDRSRSARRSDGRVRQWAPRRPTP